MKERVREQEQLQLCRVVRSIEPVLGVRFTYSEVSAAALEVYSDGIAEGRPRRGGVVDRERTAKFTRNVQGMPCKEDSITFGTPRLAAPRSPITIDRVSSRYRSERVEDTVARSLGSSSGSPPVTSALHSTERRTICSRLMPRYRILKGVTE